MLAVDWRNLIMLIVGFVLLYLGIKKDCEPLLLVPIGFGCILVNIPLSDVMAKEGFIRAIYDAGIDTELFPLLIFIGIGAMTDFGPVLAQPSTFLLGRGGPVRDLPHLASGPGPGLSPAPCGIDRDHRGL